MKGESIFVCLFWILLCTFTVSAIFITGDATEQFVSISLIVGGVPSLTIVLPENGTVLNSTNVSVEFITDGADNFWYNVDDGNNLSITGNFSFDVGTRGDYKLSLYANNSFGATGKVVYFTVSLTEEVVIVWPEGVYEPYDANLVGTHKHNFSIKITNLTANASSVLGCDIETSNESLLLLRETIAENIANKNVSLNYTITTNDSVNKITPWDIVNCTLVDSGNLVYKNIDDGPLDGRIYVHGNNWTRFDSTNDDAYRAGDCFLGIPKRYLNNSHYCDYAGDVAFAVTMSRGMNLEAYCHDEVDNDGNGNVDCTDIYCGGITYSCKNHTFAGDPFAGSCTDGVCTESKTVGGKQFTYSYTRYVRPDGLLKFRIQGDGYSTSNPVTFSITDLIGFDSYGKYNRTEYLGMPNELISTTSYKTEDADGVSGDIDYVFYVGLNPDNYTEGDYNVSLYVVQYGEDLLIAGIPIVVDSDAFSNTNESEIYAGVIEDTCADSTDNDLNYLTDCGDANCTGMVGGTNCSGGDAYCESSEVTCYDCFDNDANSYADCEDSGCDLLPGNFSDLSDLCEYSGEGYGAVNAVHNASYAWTVACTDEFDNDAQGGGDCNDLTYCWGQGGLSLTLPCPMYENNTASWCFDSVNNDFGNGTDCADYDCKDVSSGGQACPSVETVTVSGTTDLTQCFDDSDNDLDNPSQQYGGPGVNIDCQDSDCIGVTNPSNSSEVCYSQEFNLSEGYQFCADELDNDGDEFLGSPLGGTDCGDPDCSQKFGVCGPCYAYENVTWESCADELDNDGDGSSNCEESECSGEIGNKTSSQICGNEVCNDGFDNDGDGDVDCGDSDCVGQNGMNGEVCESGTETLCTDNLDNDADGSIDCVDSDCYGIGSCASSWSTSSCTTVPSTTSSQQIGSSTVSVSHLQRHYVDTNYTLQLVGTGSYSVVTITLGDATDSGNYFPYNASSCSLTGTSGLNWVASQTAVGQIQNDPSLVNDSNRLSGFDVTLNCSALGTAQSNSYPVTVANLESGFSESGERSLTATVYENTAPTVSELEIEAGNGVVEYEGNLGIRVVPNSDSSGICKCTLNVSDTLYESASGGCLITLPNLVNDTTLTFSARTEDGAGNVGVWSSEENFSVDILPKAFSSAINKSEPFFNGTDQLTFTQYYEGADDFESTCYYHLENSSGDIISTDSLINTGSGNLAICNGTITVPSVDGLYRVGGNITESSGNSADAFEKVFYVCNDLMSVGDGWSCQKADFDQDSVTEGLYTSLYGSSISCDSCPGETNSGSDVDADGIDAVCDADEVPPSEGEPSPGVRCSNDWSCSAWTECSNGQQSRICFDVNDCDFKEGKPEETQSCVIGFCSDNTAYGSCSPNLPKYCDEGNLVDRCGECGCGEGENCFDDGICAFVCREREGTCNEYSCGGNKVTVCHNSDEVNEKSLCISQSALQAHLDHGDYCGPCTTEEVDCTEGFDCVSGRCLLEELECDSDEDCELGEYCKQGGCAPLVLAPPILLIDNFAKLIAAIILFFLISGLIIWKFSTLKESSFVKKVPRFFKRLSK